MSKLNWWVFVSLNQNIFLQLTLPIDGSQIDIHGYI